MRWDSGEDARENYGETEEGTRQEREKRGAGERTRGEARMRGGGGMDDDDKPEHAQIPNSFGHELRACLRCRLVKTYDQFRENGCENCPFLDMDKDRDNVVSCTTANFTGIISLMDPNRSWAARWLRIGRFIPGCYTLAVSEELPEEYRGMCDDNNVQYHPPKRG